MVKLIRESQSKSFKPDEAMTITAYGFSTGTYDIVEGLVDGAHGTMMNRKSMKSYYIASGAGTFEIDGKGYDAGEGDIVSVESGEWLKIIGDKLKVLIISNPPFDPGDEEWR